DKIETVKQFFVESGSAKATQDAIEDYTNKAFSVLENLTVSKDKKELLKQFGMGLMTRKV
ncbi:MAG: polyprenyl synthetase family protein, partial [Flavobacteriaceae bacterium]|nr:polyprenyl synthetase family protein [Flavobacteriaceae bacterium]